MKQSDCLIKHCVASQGCSQISGPCLLHRLAPAAPAIHSTLHSLGEQKLPGSRTGAMVFTHHLSRWIDRLPPFGKIFSCKCRDSCSYCIQPLDWDEPLLSIPTDDFRNTCSYIRLISWDESQPRSKTDPQGYKQTSKWGGQTPLPLLHILCTVSTAVSRSGSPLPHSTHTRTHCGQGLLLASCMPGNTWLKGKKRLDAELLWLVSESGNNPYNLFTKLWLPMDLSDEDFWLINLLETERAEEQRGVWWTAPFFLRISDQHLLLILLPHRERD